MSETAFWLLTAVVLIVVVVAGIWMVRAYVNDVGPYIPQDVQVGGDEADDATTHGTLSSTGAAFPIARDARPSFTGTMRGGGST